MVTRSSLLGTAQNQGYVSVFAGEEERREEKQITGVTGRETSRGESFSV